MTPRTAEPAGVRLERTIPAPPHRVYRAWLDPDLLRRWLAPGGLEVTRVEIDERVGGHYRVWHADSGSDVGGFECQLLELVLDHRIVLRWGFVGPARNDGPAYDSLLTITLRETLGGGTALTLVHERLEALTAAMPDVAEDVGAGWEQALEKLTATIGAGGR
ncbi:MAG: SRPBCC domain-containing protein [Chloroflexota bacterium]|nr:SRPBCC domain-containing protein [Chloroflexota bacterium]